MPSTDQKNCIVPLALPPRELLLERDTQGVIYVFDPLRHKKVVLTPEEWVRQHFVAHLIADLGYPPSLVANEVALDLNGLYRRCDTVVWRQAAPLALVEYKAPSVAITRRVFDQIFRYNMVFRAPYLMVSNGLNHHCCKIVDNKVTFLPNIPRYEEL